MIQMLYIKKMDKNDDTEFLGTGASAWICKDCKAIHHIDGTPIDSEPDNMRACWFCGNEHSKPKSLVHPVSMWV